MFKTASELCLLLDGELVGDPDVRITGPSKIEEGKAGTISFLANPKYAPYVYTTRASVLLVDKTFKPEKPVPATLIKVDNVYHALGILLDTFQEDESLEQGISELAFIHPDAEIADHVTIGPFAYIGKQTSVAEGTRILPHVYIGDHCTIGKHVRIYSGSRVYRHTRIGNHCVLHANCVIGSDGFGFSKNANGQFEKIAQIGHVILHDYVEIGANTVIDRATMGATVLKKGVKLDNLIQVAHNVEIGEDTAMAAQSGVAGSTKIGKNVLIGGQAGIVGHLRIADGIQIGAQSGVNKSFHKPFSKILGSPAFDYMAFLKSFTIFRQLPKLKRRIESLEKEIKTYKESHNVKDSEQGAS